MTAASIPFSDAKYAHRVLVVDDYPDSAEATCMLFTRLGHCCRQATSGARALDEADAFHPDVVLLDIGLPDLSGYEVARALRQLHGREIYLAALTGWGQPEDRARAIGAGFDQHILKPATASILREVIRAAERSREENGLPPLQDREG
ncbi:MAG: response regulator [Deltaproteobacteria bacterium]|nr:MAG: response regulator [Deltaproteobacteria bacterium]TMQ17751.1 MAG: response regulator [Deltaproteobacteria bacterium]